MFIFTLNYKIMSTKMTYLGLVDPYLLSSVFSLSDLDTKIHTRNDQMLFYYIVQPHKTFVLMDLRNLLWLFLNEFLIA